MSMTAAELKQWRESHKLSLQALSELTGVPRETLWRWEKERMAIQHPTLLYLALAMLHRMLWPDGTPLPAEAD